MFLEYTAANGRQYALHPQQIRGFDGTDKETRVLATVGGTPLIFRVKRSFAEGMEEWKRAMDREGEQGV